MLILISSLWEYKNFHDFFNLIETPKKIYFIIDNEKKEIQQKSIEKIKKELSKEFFDYEFLAWPTDTKTNFIKCNELIKKHEKDKIILDISGGIKTRDLGLNYAAFNKKNVEFIGFYDFIKKDISIMPKLKIKLTKNQKTLLKFLKESLDKKKNKPLSSSSFFDQIKKLKDMGYINTKKEITLAGEIALILSE
jgi:hypothetical protein